MKEFKGTPGPWAWQKFGEDYLLTAQHGMRNIIIGANYNKNDMPEPTMNHEGFLKPVNPKQPEAMLIAASPELLTALQELVFLHSCEMEGIESGKPTKEQWFNAINKSRSAIDKALG